MTRRKKALVPDWHRHESYSTTRHPCRRTTGRGQPSEAGVVVVWRTWTGWNDCGVLWKDDDDDDETTRFGQWTCRLGSCGPHSISGVVIDDEPRDWWVVDFVYY